MTKSRLTAKQARFVEEYLVDLNATQAAIRAGYSKSTAAQSGYENLRKPEIAAAISDAQQIRSKRTEITQDKVLRELAKIGFADIRKAIRWQANVTEMEVDEDTGETKLAVSNQVQIIDSDVIDDDTAAAISEISQTDKGGLKIKMHDKKGALVDIGRHLGMFVDRVEVTHNHEDALDELDDEPASEPEPDDGADGQGT
ncbi:Phage terminase small subunit [Devosia sp. DBB001]|nr:Phage terminase small subunit [Devosia sp. DBB001]